MCYQKVIPVRTRKDNGETFQVLRRGQITVSDDTFKKFKTLTMHDQREIVQLTSKRLLLMLKGNMASDFVLEHVIAEYTYMKINRQPLEIPLDNTGYGINNRSYNQYKTLKGEVL
jgi:hypothetical protein